MPSVSDKQRKFMGAELARKRAGDATTTGMDESQLADFAATPTKGLPEKAQKRGFGSDKRSGHGRHKRPRGNSM